MFDRAPGPNSVRHRWSAGPGFNVHFGIDAQRLATVFGCPQRMTAGAAAPAAAATTATARPAAADRFRRSNDNVRSDYARMETARVLVSIVCDGRRRPRPALPAVAAADTDRQTNRRDLTPLPAVSAVAAETSRQTGAIPHRFQRSQRSPPRQTDKQALSHTHRIHRPQRSPPPLAPPSP